MELRRWDEREWKVGSKMPELRPTYVDIESIFQIDPELVSRLTQHVRAGQARPFLQITIGDIRNHEKRVLIVDWPFADVDDLMLLLYRFLSGAEVSPMEPFFWLYWRGWAGCLSPESVSSLKGITPEIISKVAAGVCLRGGDLDRLMAALAWAYADLVSPWGQADWQQGGMMPAHLHARCSLVEYIEKRMEAMHGPEYRNISVLSDEEQQPLVAD